MNPLTVNPLSKNTISTCLRVLRTAQESYSSSEAEKYALQRLVEWLDELHAEQEESSDLLANQSLLAYLQSYRDTFSRASLWQRGHSEVNVEGVRTLRDSPKSPLRGARGPLKTLAHLVRRELMQAGTVLHGSYTGGTTPEDPALAREMQFIGDWNNFDVFKVAKLTRNRPLETVVCAGLQHLDVVKPLDLPMQRVHSYLRDLERMYNNNPYHNNIHAADVVQSMVALLATSDFTTQLMPLEILAVIMACAVHDVGHPGLSNDFLINTSSDVALAYNDLSINENMHASIAFRLLRKPSNNFLSEMPEDQYWLFRRIVIHIVLGTDMALHMDSVKDFSASVKLLGTDLSAWSEEKRLTLLRFCVHCSDIGNPAKPLALSKQWTDRLMKEFAAQGHKEREAGLQVSPLCDINVDVPRSQLTFLEIVVKPCFESLKLMAPIVSDAAIHNVEVATGHWKAFVDGGKSQTGNEGQSGNEVPNDGNHV